MNQHSGCRPRGKLRPQHSDGGSLTDFCSSRVTSSEDGGSFKFLKSRHDGVTCPVVPVAASCYFTHGRMRGQNPALYLPLILILFSLHICEYKPSHHMCIVHLCVCVCFLRGSEEQTLGCGRPSFTQTLLRYLHCHTSIARYPLPPSVKWMTCSSIYIWLLTQKGCKRMSNAGMFELVEVFTWSTYTHYIHIFFYLNVFISIPHTHTHTS